MQELIYKSKFRVIKYKKSENTFYDYWQVASKNMDAEQQGQENLSLLELVAKYKPQNYLLDLRDYFYELGKEEEKEVILNSNLLLDLGIKKMALISKESLEDYELIQKLKKSNARLNNDIIQFFQEIAKAQDWLNNLH